MHKIIFSLETSCDETAVSLVEAKQDPSHPLQVKVLSHIVESQIEIHKPFGGVVPEVAARDHLAKIHDTASRAFAEAGRTAEDVTHCAVTLGPGLIGALMVGVLYARGFAIARGTPLLGINHVDAHLAPALLLPQFSPATDLGKWFEAPPQPQNALYLTVSGGHCHLGRILPSGEREILGKSIDDACGEAFDKTAKLLGLGYPGGPLIEELAKTGVPGTFHFPKSLNDKDRIYDFSFSGLKTSVLETIRRELGFPKGKVTGKSLPNQYKANIARDFQDAAIAQLFDRIQNALQRFPETEQLYIAGGVAANQHFRQVATRLSLPTTFAPLSLCSDNATMIALQALMESDDGFQVHPFPRYNRETNTK